MDHRWDRSQLNFTIIEWKQELLVAIFHGRPYKGGSIYQRQIVEKDHGPFVAASLPTRYLGYRMGLYTRAEPQRTSRTLGQIHYEHVYNPDWCRWSSAKYRMLLLHDQYCQTRVFEGIGFFDLKGGKPDTYPARDPRSTADSLSPSLFFSVPLVLYSAIHVHDTNLPLKNRRYPAITLAGYRKFETRNNGGTMDATLVFRPPSIGMYSGLIFNRGFSVKNVKYREGRRRRGKDVWEIGKWIWIGCARHRRYKVFFFFGNWKLKLFVTFNDFFFFLKGYSFCCYISLDGILISLIGNRVFLNFELLIETFWFIFFL